MDVNKTLESILAKKSKIKAENLVYGDLIFSFDNKFICTIGKHSKDFFNQEDQFKIVFYYELLQQFHKDEDILGIVLSGKGASYSTKNEGEKHTIELSSKLCFDLYTYLLFKIYKLDEIFKNILNSFNYTEPTKSYNGRPLFVIKIITDNPEKIYNINIENKGIYFQFDNYLWEMTCENSLGYNLRIFLEKDYTFEAYSKNIKSAEYIDAHYLDFGSKNFNSENKSVFEKLYLMLNNRVNNVETIFRTINHS